MTNSAPSTHSQDDLDEEPRVWNGMIGFATIMLLLLGGFHICGGFVALFEDEVYAVPSEDLAVSIDYTVWGLLHMALGVVMIWAAYALFWGRTWGRIVAVVVALVGAIGNVAFLSANPAWYSMMIVLDILVIYAVMVHGGDREY